MDFSNQNSFSKPMVENVDYYMDAKGYRVMTEKYHKERGYCCGNGCRHCPYHPQHFKGNTNLKE
jgi:hypothetical protein